MVEVIAFPQRRAVGHAKAAALEWQCQPSEPARRDYWLTVQRRYRAAMGAFGFPETVIAAELRDFAAIFDQQRKVINGGSLRIDGLPHEREG